MNLFAKVASGLRKTHHYPEMYWGGAYFFFLLDKQLKEEKDMSLCEVLVEYQKCCRMKDSSVDDVIKSIDIISKGTVATQLMHDFRNLPGREILKNLDDF